MLTRLKIILDPFIVALLGTVLIASILPARGAAAPVFATLADAGIVLLFFLHGAKLSREAVIAGAKNWRLHAAVLTATFVIFPLMGLGVTKLPFLPAIAATGILFLTLLPSTVQSSIAFTAIARGNVAAAVCSASLSNLLGTVVTPLLAALLIGSNGGKAMSLSSIESILLQLVLPFFLGQLLRQVIGGFIGRHKSIVGLVDRGSILLVVYSAFGAAVVEGLWSRMSAGEIGIIFLVCAAVLAASLFVTWYGGRLIGLPREDRIVLLFCGSKKSLASGVPIASVLFAPAQVGLVILPVMIFHQIQLIACAFIARHLADQPVEAPARAAARPI